MLSLPGGGLALPARVRDMIARRLQRLGEPSRRLLALAAVIGRDFDLALLRCAARLGEAEAVDGVEELVRRRLLREIGGGFDFVHDRIREVASAQLLRDRRTLLHRQVAGPSRPSTRRVWSRTTRRSGCTTTRVKSGTRR